MSVGKRILELRLRSRKSQREVGESTGLAVSYLSRLENDRIAPTVRTLGKIAKAFGVSLTAFFDSEPILEAADRCPVSLSGKCILDQLYMARGKKPQERIEGYSPRQLQVLRLCNFLVHTQDTHLLQTLRTMLESLLALSQSRAAGRNKKGPRVDRPKPPTD
ncbi:MAG: helix-turn-helix domain-containing protein [Deltaproteobacteria bacterium]|nr:helix-turn-helix domain-containing protein [Deltaproteobacteria bacterium]